MSWDLKKIAASGDKPELSVTSFFGGQDTGRCLQLTQTETLWDGEERTQFVSLSREQLFELVQRVHDWDTGVASEHDPHGNGTHPDDIEE